MRALGMAVLLGFVAAACREQGRAPAPSASAPPAVSAAPAASTASPSTSIPRELPSAAPGPVADAGTAAPVGGNWLRCYAQFQPRTRPELDVLRLGLMCGPSNGMRKVVEAKEATLSAPGKEREHRFTAEVGDCFRVFAVAEPSIEDLDVEVMSPSGKKVAFDTSDDRWPIVKPDGPFCVFDGGEHRALVRAQRGQGRYAIEIWRLH